VQCEDAYRSSRKILVKCWFSVPVFARDGLSSCDCSSLLHRSALCRTHLWLSSLALTWHRVQVFYVHWDASLWATGLALPNTHDIAVVRAICLFLLFFSCIRLCLEHSTQSVRDCTSLPFIVCWNLLASYIVSYSKFYVGCSRELKSPAKTRMACDYFALISRSYY
jgi:hypothetical protein